jgi:hypothetical protein
MTPNGRIVRVRTFDNSGGYSGELWWAAVDDDAGAAKAVMVAARTKADDGVEAIGPLPAATITAHGLLPGQAIPAKG